MSSIGDYLSDSKKKSSITDFFSSEASDYEGHERYKKKKKKSSKKYGNLPPLPSDKVGEYNPDDYSMEEMIKDADNFEAYLNTIKMYAILKNVSPEDYNKAVKDVEKMIKHLRKGEYWKVYDNDRHRNYIMKFDD